MSGTECAPFAADCHVRAAADLISHSWDCVVLTALRDGPPRRSVLIARIGGASDKVITESLQRLILCGLVSKSAAGSVRVYALTDLGASFAAGPLLHLAEWAAANQADLA